MIPVRVTVFEAAGFTASKKTETMLFRTPHQVSKQKKAVVTAADQKYKRTNQFHISKGVPVISTINLT